MHLSLGKKVDKFHAIIRLYHRKKIGESEPMDPMTKMWVSLIAMLVMGLSVFLITFARTKTTGFLRGTLSFVAFIIMVVGFLGGMAALM